MTDQDVWTTFCTWLEPLVNVTVIKANPSADRPALPYVMVNMAVVSEVRERPQDTEIEITGNVTPDGKTEIKQNPVVETEWMFSVHAYGPTPTDLLRIVKQARFVEQYLFGLYPLSIHDMSELRRVPEFINLAWEPRAQVDVFLRGLVRDGLVIDTIEDYSFDFNRET